VAPRLGIRLKQLQIIDLANKRIAFWDTYLKTALSTTEWESERKALKQEVRSAIQRVRSETGQELRRVSWFQLRAEKRIAAAELKGVQKLKWVCLWVLTCVFSAIFLLILAYGLWISEKKDLGFLGTVLVDIIALMLAVPAVSARLAADRIKYPRPRPIAEEI
jgi:hypothetical protein